MTLLYNTGVKTIYVKRHSPKTNIWILVCEYDRPSKKPQTVCQVFDEFHAHELRLMFCKMYGLNPNIIDRRDWFAIKGQISFTSSSIALRALAYSIERRARRFSSHCIRFANTVAT